MQFMALYDETAGFYLAAYNSQAYAKQFGVEKGRGFLRPVLAHLPPSQPQAEWRTEYTWDFPLVWDIETGRRTYGSDYYQNMMLWSVPAVLAGQDLSGPCKPGGLVDRIVKAAANR